VTPQEASKQREDALARANRIRIDRARSKRDLRARRCGLTVALEMECWQSAKVFDLLLCVPTLGRVKVNARLARLGINPSRKVEHLTERQVADILEVAVPVSGRAAA